MFIADPLIGAYPAVHCRLWEPEYIPIASTEETMLNTWFSGVWFGRRSAAAIPVSNTKTINNIEAISIVFFKI